MKMSVTQSNVRANDSVELLSYIINSTPELRANLDLPVQGESIAPIGKIIMGNPVYKNAFLNTVNLIGKTVITRNHWENPWRKFTDKGTLTYGQQVRDIIVDIANIYDYNNFANRPHAMLETEVPNVLQTLYEVNYQKFYKTTTSDEQMGMAFETGDLFSLIDEIVNSMYEGMEYDDFLVSKYILARRILDGTVTAKQIPANLTARETVSFIKGISNKMTFRSPNYNPAAIRKATEFENQFAILDSDFEATVSTEVLATSFFKDEAEMKARSELTDGFGTFDMARMVEIFGKRDENGNIIEGEYLDGYVPFTDAELQALSTIPCAIVGMDFFQNRRYGTDTQAPGGKATDFYNPQTLKRNHWLHEWGVIATSPFENAVVFTTNAQAIQSVSINPQSATVTKGQSLNFSATVNATGFANKAVIYSINDVAETSGAKISQDGKLQIPANYKDVAGTAGVYELTIDTALVTDGSATLFVGSAIYHPDASEDTAIKQATALLTVLQADSDLSSKYTMTRASATIKFTENSGKYGEGAPIYSVEGDGKVSMETTTDPAQSSSPITVTATSVYDKTKKANATITIV